MPLGFEVTCRYVFTNAFQHETNSWTRCRDDIRPIAMHRFPIRNTQANVDSLSRRCNIGTAVSRTCNTNYAELTVWGADNKFPFLWRYDLCPSSTESGTLLHLSQRPKVVYPRSSTDLYQRAYSAPLYERTKVLGVHPGLGLAWLACKARLRKSGKGGRNPRGAASGWISILFACGTTGGRWSLSFPSPNGEPALGPIQGSDQRN